MREIKFRVWDNNKWFIDDNKPGHLLGYAIDFNKPIMQYTGLKDKNGKDIYEGDVVAVDLEDWIVKWDDDEAMSWLHKDEKWNTLSIHREDEIEVIGNIHENPGLI